MMINICKLAINEDKTFKTTIKTPAQTLSLTGAFIDEYPMSYIYLGNKKLGYNYGKYFPGDLNISDGQIALAIEDIGSTWWRDWRNTNDGKRSKKHHTNAR